MPRTERFRLGLTLWLAGMVGVVLMTLTVLPQILQSSPVPAPMWVVVTVSVGQSAILLALAAWAGATLSRPIGFGAPAIEAKLSGMPFWPALKPQLAPATAAGVAIGGLMVALAGVTPAGLAEAGRNVEFPIATKLLYGGITEEVLMRWGFMTGATWLAWRFLQKGQGRPRSIVVVGAIVVAALLFGVLHLPAAQAMGVNLSPAVIVYVVGGNTAAATLFGLLYWRQGLESAIVAHALAHGVATLAAAA